MKEIRDTRLQGIRLGSHAISYIKIFSIYIPTTVHYNMVNFLQNTHNWHPIAHPWWQAIGCILWVWLMFYISHSNDHCKPLYCVMLDHAIMAHNCTKFLRFNKAAPCVQYSLTLLGYPHKRPMSRIPQCITQISHNAPFCNRNVHMCTFLLQNGALWGMGLVHCGNCATGLLQHTGSRKPSKFYNFAKE